MAGDLIFGPDLKLPSIEGLSSTCETELYKLLKEVDEAFLAKCQKLKDEREVILSECAEKDRIIQMQEAQIRSLESVSSDQLAELENLRRKCSEGLLKKETINHQETVKKIEREFNKTKKDLKSANLLISQKNQIIEEQTTELISLKSLEKQYHKLEESLERFKFEILEKNKAIKEREKEISSVKNLLKFESTKNENLQNLLQLKEQKLERLSKENLEKQKELRDEFKKELEAERERYLTAKRILDGVLKSYMNLMAEYQEIIKEVDTLGETSDQNYSEIRENLKLLIASVMDIQKPVPE